MIPMTSPSHVRDNFAPALAPAHRILEIVFRHRNVLPTEPAGVRALRQRGAHLRKVIDFLSRGEPIHLVLPAFPAKSPNPEKTSGSLPDFGEVLALERLEGLARAISRIYPPGARITLCSDGRVFSDLVLVEDQNVGRYAEGIRGILGDRGLTHIDTFSLEDAFPSQSFDEMRCTLVGRYGESLESLREKIRTDSSERQLFNGLHRFLFEDRAVLSSGSSRSQVRELSKTVAYHVIQRSHAWSSLVGERFPRALRLSIHPQPESSPKIGLRLVDGPDRWATPWHGVVLSDGNTHWLTKRKEAESRGARLATLDGKYAYYLLERREPA